MNFNSKIQIYLFIFIYIICGCNGEGEEKKKISEEQLKAPLNSFSPEFFSNGRIKRMVFRVDSISYELFQYHNLPPVSVGSMEIDSLYPVSKYIYIKDGNVRTRIEYDKDKNISKYEGGVFLASNYGENDIIKIAESDTLRIWAKMIIPPRQVHSYLI